MRTNIPILIIIPHGGLEVPDELSGYEGIDKFGIFIESDVCANDLFSFQEQNIIKIDTNISRLFIDHDRPPEDLPPKSSDGVIKTESAAGRKIFKEKILPDRVAISNILQRYYSPFHNTIDKIIKTGGIKLIIDCHTMMPVGPRNSRDAGKPRAVINIQNTAYKDKTSIKTCPSEITEGLASIFKKIFSDEASSVAGTVSINKPFSNGYILNKYGPESIPVLRLSLSRALFLNDKYFNYDYMTIDSLRINSLKEKLFEGVEKFLIKYF